MSARAGNLADIEHIVVFMQVRTPEKASAVNAVNPCCFIRGDEFSWKKEGMGG